MGIGPLKVNDVLISDDKNIATELNNFFCSVFNQEDANNSPIFHPLESNSILNDILFSETQVKEKI